MHVKSVNKWGGLSLFWEPVAKDNDTEQCRSIDVVHKFHVVRLLLIVIFSVVSHQGSVKSLV